jgi:hypothetical protein
LSFQININFLIIKIMKKNKKKNNKKVQAKINTTPAKAEATKKEVSKIAKENNKTADKAAKAAANKADKIEKQEKKYAASKARIEARKARKKGIMDKLLDSKKTKDSSPAKITLEDRKKRQENRRKVAYNRHIASVRRRCSRMGLTDEQTDAIINKAKAQWDSAKQYDLVIVYESSPKKKASLEKLVKDTGVKAACITGSTAFLKEVPKDSVDKIRELLAGDTIYQYRTDKENLFEEYKVPKKPSKKGGDPHSRECSKSRSINFYNLRRLKKAEKEAMEEVKPVNKKPTQVKEIKSKSNKQAA